MTLKRFCFFLISLILILSITNFPVQSTATMQLSTNHALEGKPSLAQAQTVLTSHSGFFTENKGQWDPSILFVGDTSFGKVAFTKDAIYYQLIECVASINTKDWSHGDVSRGSDKFKVSNYRSQIVKLTFVNPKAPQVNGAGLLSHYNNYLKLRRNYLPLNTHTISSCWTKTICKVLRQSFLLPEFYHQSLAIKSDNIDATHR